MLKGNLNLNCRSERWKGKTNKISVAIKNSFSDTVLILVLMVMFGLQTVSLYHIKEN